jgi:hypothetical protein
MFTRLLVLAALAVPMSQAALAQNSGNPNPSQSPSASQSNQNSTQSSSTSQEQDVRNIPQHLRQQLSDAGFKDITIVPGSFFVSAKDKNDRDVMMRITPQSVTVLTESPMDTSSTTGQGQSGSSNDRTGQK